MCGRGNPTVQSSSADPSAAPKEKGTALEGRYATANESKCAEIKRR